ncbi:MAG: T9SS type A sorting domain-containing protein [Bacteroidia bacterium]|nr:T9SS type A sorting domain-containing protein [Bacteroidia bacterium]
MRSFIFSLAIGFLILPSFSIAQFELQQKSVEYGAVRSLKPAKTQIPWGDSTVIDTIYKLCGETLPTSVLTWGAGTGTAGCIAGTSPGRLRTSTNSYYVGEVGQRFDISANAKVLGTFAAILGPGFQVGTKINGSDADSFRLRLYTFTNRPGNLIATKYYTIDDLGDFAAQDPSPFNTYLAFDSAVTVGTRFFMSFEVQTPTSDDIVALYHTDSSCGTMSKYFYWGVIDSATNLPPASPSMRWNNVDNIFQGGLLADLYILPVVADTGSTVGINNPISMANLKILGTFPNPACEQAVLRYEMAKAMPVTVSIMNATGQVVYQVHQDSVAGMQELRLPVSDWANGTYFAAFFTPEGRIATNIIVSH